MSNPEPHPIRRLRAEVRRDRDRLEKCQLAALVLTMGAAVWLGCSASTGGHYINPKALVVAAAFLAAYKSIEAITKAFAQKARSFDEALSEAFTFLGGLAMVCATVFACTQRANKGDPLPAIATGPLCLVLLAWGLIRAEWMDEQQ